MTDSEQVSPALIYFLKSPKDVEVGATAEFKLDVYAPDGDRVSVKEIQILIPFGNERECLAERNILDFSVPNNWQAHSSAYHNSILFVLSPPADVDFEISGRMVLPVSFSIPINSLTGTSAITIVETVRKDGHDVSTQTKLQITKYESAFSISNLKCIPAFFVPGERLHLQFQISGELPANKLPFRIDYTDNQRHLQSLSKTYDPNVEPNGYTFQQGLITVPLASSDLNEHDDTKFELIYFTTNYGQSTDIEVGTVTASPLNIFDFINPAPSSDPRNLGAIALGDRIVLKWRYEIPAGSNSQPRFSVDQTLLCINGGKSIPIEPKLVNGVHEYEVDSPSLWPATATAGSQEACRATLQLIAVLEASDGTRLPAKSGLLEVHPYQFQGLTTAKISQNAGTWTISKYIPIRPAPIGFLEHLSDTVTLPMLWIPAGSFMMGSLPEESLSVDSERPQHLVQLQGFFLAQSPITQGQWLALMHNNPSGFSDQPDSTQRPVEKVTWNNAMEFCNRLNQSTGRRYTLPSEAQWEYACRAGSSTPFAYGATLSAELANYDATSTYDDGPKGEYRQQTTPVGMFPANAWGLQDMHGNVWEWCLDEWQWSYEGAPTDGSAWQSGGDGTKLLRGGCWEDDPRPSRSAFRHRFQPVPTVSAYDIIGFRVVCLPQGPSLNA